MYVCIISLVQPQPEYMYSSSSGVVWVEFAVLGELHGGVTLEHQK